MRPCILPDLEPIDVWTRLRKSRKPTKAKTTKQKADKRSTQERVQLPAVAQPALTQELAQIFTGCVFMRKFRERPDLATHQEWTHAGMVLASLGQPGAQWFRHLSSLDKARYDGSHEQVITAVSEASYRPPNCSAMGCSRCEAKSPLDFVSTVHRRYRTALKTDQQSDIPAPAINIDAVIQKYVAELRQLLDSGQTGCFLVNLPLGAGKTTQTVQAIREAGKRFLFYVPTHRLATQVCEGFGIKAKVEGLDHMEKTAKFKCPHKAELYASVTGGLSGGKYCHRTHGKCRLRHACPYLEQFLTAAQEDAVVLVHNHLSLGEDRRKALLRGRDLIVIDESFVSACREEGTFHLADIEALEQAIASNSGAGAIRNRLAWLKSQACGVIQLGGFQLYARQFHEIDNHFRNFSPGRQNILRTLHRCAQDRLPIERVNETDFRVSLPVSLPHDKLILILDGTAQNEDYERLLGWPVTVINPAAGKKLQRHAHVTQVVSGGYSNSSLLKESKLSVVGERVLSFVHEKMRDPQDTGIICTKQMERFLKDEQVFPGIEIMHYNDLRGLNTLSTARDLFIIGYQGLSYTEIARQARIKFGRAWDDNEVASRLDQQKDFIPLNMTGKQTCEVLTLMPSDPYIESYYRMTVIGEVEQAVGRARMYRDCGKEDRRIWILTNLPTSLEVDEVVELPAEKQTDPILATACRLLAQKGAFDRKTLATEAGVSERHIRAVISQIVVSLGLEVTTVERNRKVYRGIQAKTGAPRSEAGIEDMKSGNCADRR